MDEAVLGNAGYGVQDRGTGVWLSDGYDSPSEALGRARQIREAAGEAQEWFWRRVAFLFPRATSGDFAPDAQEEFDRVCLRAVAAWVRDNDVTEEESKVEKQTDTVQTTPSVYLVMGNDGMLSACAFEESGEILETVDWNEDGSPDWTDAGMCDHRGMGGQEGFRLLHEALSAAEANLRAGEMEVRRVPRERGDDSGEPARPLNPVDPSDLGFVADSLEYLADIDEGEHTDDERLRRVAGGIRGEQQRERVALGADEWTEDQFPAAIGIYPGTRVRLLHDVDRYPHFIARAGSLGTVTEQCDLDAIEVRMDEHLPGAEEWGNAILWHHDNAGDEILRDVEPVDPSPRDRVAGEIQRRIVRSLDDWREGRNASPTELDFVVIARETMREMYPGFIGTTPEGEQFNADVLSDDAGEKYVTSAAIAAFLYESLTAE